LFGTLYLCTIFLPLHAKPQRPVFFIDSQRVYAVQPSGGLPQPAVRDHVAKADGGAKAAALKNMLDSLGFFHVRRDTVHDTVFITPGGQSIVRFLQVKSASPFSVDSLLGKKPPFPYDAGEIQVLAKKTLFIFGTRGYPFAALSISFVDTADTGRAGSGAGGYSVGVVFDVRENGRYAFSKPLFIGAIKTSRRLLSHDVTYREGDLFDLRKVEESRSRLLLRPYVSTVEVSSPAVLLEPVMTPDVMADSLRASRLDRVLVPFSCTDNMGLGVDGALSLQAGGASPASTFFGIINLSLLNLLHGGEAAQLSYNGQKDLQKLEMSLSKPYLLELPLFVSAGFGLEIRQDSYGYLHGDLTTLTDLWTVWQFGLSLTGHTVSVSSGDSLDTLVNQYQFYGADIILKRQRERYRAGAAAKGFEIRTGSGIAQTGSRQFDRWHVDCLADVHVPITRRQAVACRMKAAAIFSDPQDTLQTVELYRTGGYNSLRGYTDNEFAFKTVLFGQLEYLYYFRSEASIYIFADGGAGLGPFDEFRFDAATKMLGYGIGIRIPVAIGLASIEWARNYKEKQGLGRIHISIQNAVAAALRK
jgi:hypothetical protein